MKVSSIEEGYPIPPSVPRNNKYNLHLMKVGQCFNKKFGTRKIIEENGDWKLRVWREA